MTSLEGWSSAIELHPQGSDCGEGLSAWPLVPRPRSPFPPVKSLLFTEEEESRNGGLVPGPLLSRKSADFRRGGGITERSAPPGLPRRETQRSQSRRGAVDETRTRDLNLGKVALYQLSYYRRYPGNPRPGAWLVRTKRLELLRR